MKGFPALSLGRKSIDPPKGLRPLNAKTLLTKHLAKQLAEVTKTTAQMKKMPKIGTSIGIKKGK